MVINPLLFRSIPCAFFCAANNTTSLGSRPLCRRSQGAFQGQMAAGAGAALRGAFKACLKANLKNGECSIYSLFPAIFRSSDHFSDC